MPSPDLDTLRADLAEEQSDLDSLVSDLSESQWRTATPAEGWTVADQIAHLAFFDEKARLAIADHVAFAAELGEIAADPDGFVSSGTQRARQQQGRELLGWWREARALMLDAFATLAPDQRVPWYGPPMSPASFVSARLMETWAHGQDVVDALGMRRVPTDRLRHVAHLGVRARPYAYSAHWLGAPRGEVRVELRAPSGAIWTWGPEDAVDVVVGDAEDFCLVVTRRRHPADTALVARGPLAEEWLPIAQAFAGPPGPGRRPGQFTRSRL